MIKEHDDVVKAVIQALENPRFNWRTIQGISEETSLSRDVVIEALSRVAEIIVKSPGAADDGSDLFTTRDHFRKEGGVTAKFMGAIKNRIL